jgi:hypothetical protein
LDQRIKSPMLYQLSYAPFGVTDGTRTRDYRYHKPGIYQLIYSHRSGGTAYGGQRNHVQGFFAGKLSAESEAPAARSREALRSLAKVFFVTGVRGDDNLLGHCAVLDHPLAEHAGVERIDVAAVAAVGKRAHGSRWASKEHV